MLAINFAFPLQQVQSFDNRDPADVVIGNQLPLGWDRLSRLELPGTDALEQRCINLIVPRKRIIMFNCMGLNCHFITVWICGHLDRWT